MLSCYFCALRLGGVLTSPQATPSGLQMTPPSLPGTENPGKHGSPDFILIIHHFTFLKFLSSHVHHYTLSGLDGKDSLAKARVDMVVDCIDECSSKLGPVLGAKNDEEKV